MGLDFDVLEFCKKLRLERPPPYQCPLEKCDRVYKSLCGLQYHLVRFDHETGVMPAAPPPRKKGGRLRPAAPTGDIALQSPPREALTFAEAHKVVQFEIDGKISRIAIDQELPVISLEDWTKRNSELEKPFTFTEPVPEPHIKLPEASYKVIEDYNIADAPPRPNAYIRFIEKSAEELDGEVEYDVDEEDTAWLSITNEKRQKTNLPPVSIDTLELLMDRLEKESYFQATQSGQQSGGVVDDDAVCCICMDGECQNTNVILFCDMCNLAVHQDCYGVPYIPEGQWLCRRCLQSPSRLVNCVLCPNTGGAFKQTDRGQWAHVVCALWIPEVRFANTVFLEPIDSIETIPMARWRLTCYVCKQKNIGACIQCHRANCYSAFHVTCAQHAGLYMKMDAVNGTARGGALDAAQSMQVAKMAYCDAHTPPGVQREKLEENGAVVPVDENESSSSKDKMKQARRMLAKKRSSVPVVLIPTIPADKVQEIASMVQMSGRAQFVQRLIAYWTLKRQYRNGVPLLRRLQSLSHHSGGGRSNAQDVDTRELYNQLKYWQRIRQDLERARLLCELVRKRERLKAELTRVSERCLMHQLKPTQAALRKLITQLQMKDTSDIFSEPVDVTEVPDYSSVVTHPMDLSTMMQKLDKGLYPSIEPLERDFDLMIANCLAYNSKETVFYKAGVKMKDQGAIIIRQARKDMLESGLLDEDTQMDDKLSLTPRKSKDRSLISSPRKPQESPSALEEELDNLVSERNPGPETVKMIIVLVEKLKKYPLHQMAPRLARKVKNILAHQKTSPTTVGRKRKKRASQSDGSGSEEELSSYINKVESPFSALSTQQKLSPNASQCENQSPTSVNRRSAILFTRKSQSTASFSQLRLPRNLDTPTLSPSKSVNLGSSFSLKANESISDVLGSGLASPPIKKKGRGRPRKHKPEVLNKGRLAFGKSEGNSDRLNRQTPVPASFLVYRGPRDEAGSGADSDSGRSLSSYSTCSSCSNLDDMSSDSDCCSTSTGTDDSSFNDTLESTTNQTLSDTEQSVTRMPDVGLKKLNKLGNSPPSRSRWSSERSEGETDTPPIVKKRRGRLPNKVVSKNQKESPKKSDHISLDSTNLEPLQLVWAKCRGYPWYPALIMDPKIPKGYIHNGVPLPAPPQDVLALKKNHAHEPILYLVLFFDAKRTWQWLPPGKLELLGLKKSLDQAKLVESRKPAERKAVKKAFQDAMQYRRQVEGEDVVSK